jgi:hypothetical protein
MLQNLRERETNFSIASQGYHPAKVRTWYIGVLDGESEVGELLCFYM